MGKVRDPEPSSRRASVTIEHANNFDFGNEAGEGRQTEAAGRCEAEEDRDAVYDSSKLGKKVRLAKMLRSEYDEICTA